MSRRPRGRREAADLHDRFATWLLADPRDALPRDVALHAAYCEGCQQRIAALDALTTIDPGRAGLPPSRATQPEPAWRPARAMLAGAASLVLLAAAGGVVTGSGLLQLPAGLGAPAETPVQAVLGGTGGSSAGARASAAPAATGSPSTSQSPSPTASPTASPSATPTPSP